MTVAGLGIGLFITALVFLILVWFMLRQFTNRQAGPLGEAASFADDFSTAESEEAIIIVQAGGRIDYISPAARGFFDMREDEPHDLERLARRVRPSEDFVDLCARPGVKRVSISGRLLEITSHRVPGVSPVMMLSLRRREAFSTSADLGGGSSEEILRIVSSFSQGIASSLDLQSTVTAILENVSRIVPSDLLELKLIDPATQLPIIYHFQEDDIYRTTAARASSSHFGSLTQQVIQSRAPVLLADVRSMQEMAAGEFTPVHSYLGVPLMAGNEMIAILEAGQSGGGAFGTHDRDFLQLISGQAAVALRNARLYEDEQTRVAELAGLARLNQSLASIREEQDLYALLVESIAPLFKTEMTGFLIYDEEKRTIEAQKPFRGLPQHLVEAYRSPVPADSKAEKLITSQKPVISVNAAEDDAWKILGLTDVATAASMRDQVLMPLISSGRALGYLQVGKHREGASPFTDEELRVITIAANQAAAIIENVLLVRQARLRALRADALRRISALAASSATVDEKLKFTMRELGSLFQADAGAIFLLDAARGQLRLKRESTFGVSEEVSNSFIQIYVDDPNYRYTVSGSQRPFISGRLSTDRRVLLTYQPLATALKMESAIVVPLIARDQSVGELMIGSHKPDYFNSYDLQIITTAAGQIAGAVEADELVSQTDDTLRRRVDQLSAIARLSREFGASLDVKNLMGIIHHESMRVARAECASVFLFDESESGQYYVNQAHGCEEPRELTEFDKSVLASGEQRVVDHYTTEAGTLRPPHEGVASSIISPIIYQGRPLGLLSVHARTPSFFTQDDANMIGALAIQAGIALSNAQRYQSEKYRAEIMRRRSDTLVKLADVSFTIGHDQPLDQALNVIARGIRDSTPFRVVLMSIVEPEIGMLRRLTAVGIPQETLNELLTRKQPIQSVKQLMRSDFKISRSYFIPADQMPVVPSDVHIVNLDINPVQQVKNPNAWDTDDFLLVPLENVDGEMIGLISLDDPSNGLRPDLATIESVEAFAAQAALILNGVMRQADLRARIDSLASGLQRQQKLLEITQNDLPTLLHKDLEQTISLHNLDRRAQRVRAGLAITESVSRQLDASSALSALGRETLTQLGMSVALVAENTPEGPRLLHVLGSLPRSTNVEALFGQRNPLRACLQNGQPVLIANLDENEEWRDVSLLTALRAKGVICLPVMVENRPVAAMLATSPEAMPEFTDEDRQVYFQIAQQTSLILQNISLLNQTRRRLEEVNLLLDFSRQLSNLDPDGMLKALLESSRRVLQHAHAGVVMLWNPQTELLSPRAVSGYADNASMTGINYRIGEALPSDVFMNKVPRRVDEINFARDYNLSTENLAYYRQATAGRLPVSSLMIPIIANENAIGLLVLDNFNTVGAFRSEDEALLVSLSQQVALSLDNVRLVHGAQERAIQLQALNSASATLTASLRSEDLVKSLLDQVAPIIPYDTATLWLRDKDRLAVVSVRGFADADQRLGLSIYVADSALFKELAQTARPILVNDVREDPRFPPVEAPRLSWLGIPLISKSELVGVIALEKWQAHYYTREQMQVALTFGSQAAVSLENARLYEDSVSRATELDQRSQRLAVLNRFASGLNGLLDVDAILNLTADEIFKGLGVKRASVVTFERGAATWKYTTPKARFKLPRPVSHSPIFNRLRESLGIFTTDNVASEPDLVMLSELFGEDTTAMMILPLVSGQTLTALIFAQMSGNVRFTMNEIELARTLSNQASIALENARLYQSSVKTAERLSILNETSSRVSGTFNAEEIYAAVHQAAARLVPLDSVVITVLDEATNEIDPIYLFENGKRLQAPRVPFGRGMSSEIIKSGKPLLISSVDEADRIEAVKFGDEEKEETQSIIAVPLMIGGKALGMLSVQGYQPGLYTEEDVQILGTLANQAAVAIQNGRLFMETQHLAEQMEARVAERTAQLTREQQNTETLLRILTEVSSSLDLDRALNRTLSLLNDAIGAEQGTIMLLHAEDNLLHYRAGYGYLTDRTDTTSRGFTLRVGEGLAGWVVQNREAALIHDLREDPRWVRSGSSGQDHRSAMAVPMMVGEDVIGVLMVFQRAENFFSAEMLNLVKAIAGQVAVAINNAHLYELIRDQAERLGVMLRKEQEEASRSQAILEAVADGVLVTGADNRITFINSSTERILGVGEGRLLGNSLDGFAGLFGNASTTWMDTIRNWSENPSSFQSGDSYAEKIELGNGRIALVHLAPVILQNDFLGTVSIFRDITHEVEVDRLKSEFVATVSHELRTPMTAIKGYVDILKMGAAGALNENQNHFLGIVHNNIDRLNALVDDLLDISRIESGRITLNPQPVDLRELAEDVIEGIMRRSQNENKPIALSLDAPKHIPPVLGDADRVRQILDNLIDNAYHYTPENGMIRVGIHQENGDVQIDIQDNGVGISPEDQGRIFERFYRGEHPLVLATPGTGLGLPIVRQLVEMQNGKIWMKSSGVSGEGSVFSFTLPVHK